MSSADELLDSTQSSRFPETGPKRRSGSWKMAQIREFIERDERLRRVDQYVRENITEPIRLEDAARVAALSRAYFSSYFRQQTGIGFLRWLQRLRVRRAEALMRNATKTLAEIGYRSGFKDTRTFQRTFKRHRGSCPSAAIECPIDDPSRQMIRPGE